MNYLVTGAAGFIGSHLTEALLSRGHTVTGFDNFDSYYQKSVKERNLAIAMKSPNFKLVEGDLRTESDIHALFEANNYDSVIHLAAKAGVRPSIESPKDYFEVNVNGTLNLLEAMRLTGHKKMIFASSSSVYGNNKKTPFSEHDPVDDPISPYAATKKAGELLCKTYHNLYGFDIYALRFFSVYGPRQRPDMGIHKFLSSFMEGKAITMFGDGSSKRDYTYIDDIINGTLKAVERCSGFEIVNLGESKTVSLKSLIDEVRTVTQRDAEIKYLPMQPGDVFETNADIEKAKHLLDYSPKTDIKKGLKAHFDYLNTFQ
ncbi:MAG: SDR family NAD(P)-dependent oxidoreductase [Balneola sp.]|nr:MAG: SDR family NAD(P)-dependent oxidoreductase [Balneola sp.]